MGDAVTRKIISALRVDVPGSNGPGGQPLPRPPPPPASYGSELRGCPFLSGGVRTILIRIYGVGLVSTQLGANGTVKLLVPQVVIFCALVFLSVHVSIGRVLTATRVQENLITVELDIFLSSAIVLNCTVIEQIPAVATFSTL